MKRLQLLAVVCVLFLAFAPLAEGAEQKGEFILFLGGSEAGREDFSVTAVGLETRGSISVGPQTLVVESELTGEGGHWEHYSAAFLPGADFAATFEKGKMRFEVGPLRREYPLREQYVVLENNVFAHYLQLLQLGLAEGEQLSLQIVVPSLILANQSPSIEGQLEHKGSHLYQVGEELIFLQELVLTMAGNLQVRLVADDEQNLLLLEIPLQGVEVFRSGYEELFKVSSQAGSVPQWVGEEFKVENEGIMLAGTLALPAHGKPPFPAILLNSGSGPQDRDGNMPPVYMADMFKTMVEHLTSAGFSVLVYDERGVGESSGDYGSASLNNLLSDVEALLNFLLEHPLVDETRLAMLGHSEGAVFAPIFAPRLAALILLAGPSIPLDELMHEQIAYQLEQAWLTEQEREILNELLPQVEQVLAEAREGKKGSTVLQINLDWLRQHMELDPLANLAKVRKQPVLIVQGEADLKVMPYHAQKLADTLRHAGNENVELHYLAGTTHEFGFFMSDSRFDPLEPLRINPLLFELVTEWLSKNL